jgi:hypothetical protein
MRRIKMAEDHGADRKYGSADPNSDRGFLLGDVVRRFHSQVTAALLLSSFVATRDNRYCLITSVLKVAETSHLCVSGIQTIRPRGKRDAQVSWTRRGIRVGGREERA